MVTPKTSAGERPYHHGALRQAVIDTAIDMLREERDWQFTLREIARRAGVSHGAPYKHFADKAALLAELTMIGFDRLRDSMVQAGMAAGTAPQQQVLPVAQAYVQFGTDNPALYRLMFSAEGKTTAEVHLSEKAMGVFNLVIDLLGRGQADGTFRVREVRGQAAACWSMIHGLTMLAIDGLLLPEKVGSAPLESALGTLLEGLGAKSGSPQPSPYGNGQ